MFAQSQRIFVLKTSSRPKGIVQRIEYTNLDILSRYSPEISYYCRLVCRAQLLRDYLACEAVILMKVQPLFYGVKFIIEANGQKQSEITVFMHSNELESLTIENYQLIIDFITNINDFFCLHWYRKNMEIEKGKSPIQPRIGFCNLSEKPL